MGMPWEKPPESGHFLRRTRNDKNNCVLFTTFMADAGHSYGLRRLGGRGSVVAPGMNPTCASHSPPSSALRRTTVRHKPQMDLCSVWCGKREAL